MLYDVVYIDYSWFEGCEKHDSSKEAHWVHALLYSYFVHSDVVKMLLVISFG
jgi:hypothetical protein